jgi:crossover junction endodeoxyribonuclease RuvC
MKILGIDPGTVVMGYGVVANDPDGTALVEYGAIAVPDHLKTAERLDHLYRELLKVIRRTKPDMVAVEQPFVAKNVRSAIAIGRAQAIALLAAASQKIPAYEYTPTQVKQRVANYGASSKEQVQEMVRLQLNLAETPEPNDAADALAVALCHIQEVHINNLLTRQGEKQ